MGPQRVLVVDDDPDYRLLVRLALTPGRRFDVVAEAGDGAAAVAAAERAQPDIVLLDCTLPGADAFDALPALRTAAPEARIVLVSGHDPADLRLASRSAGAVGYLTKATPARRLAAELEALVGLVGAVEQLLSEASRRFDHDALTPRAARRFVSEALTGWDDGEGDLTDTVTLLVSELVTNAVVHAGSDRGDRRLDRRRGAPRRHRRGGLRPRPGPRRQPGPAVGGTAGTGRREDRLVRDRAARMTGDAMLVG